MHELGVTRSILKICLDNIEGEDKRIKIINLAIGEFSGYVPEVIQHYFKYVSKGTSCEGAQIKWEIQNARRECGECGEEISLKELTCCPECESENIVFVHGRDILVDSIVVDEK